PEISQDNFKNIISNLSNMLNDKYDSRIKNPKELISSTLHDISAPSDISQRDIGTCAGTSIQIQLALKDPIQYIKMIDTFAKNKPYKSESRAVINPNWTFKNEGKPELDKNGKPFKDKSGNIQYHPETNRTISSKIMQNAIMDYADGKRKYDSASSDENINSGLDDNEIKRGLEGVFPNKARIYSINNFSPEQLVNIAIKAKPSLANPVEINLNYADKGRDASHAVDLINVDKQKGLATIINPWGREETFPLSTLKDRITSVINVEKEKINTEKMSDTDLKNMIDNKINVNGINQIINKVNDASKKDSFLNSLNLDQKVKLIDTFSKKNPMPEENKKACLSVLENLLQGSEAQISDTSSTLNDKLKEKNISFDKLMDRLKLNDPSYYRLARIVDNANPEFNLATTLINDPKTSAKFISVLNKDQKIDIIDTLAKNYLAYDKKNEYPEDKKTVVVLWNNLLESEKSDKIFPDLDIKSKITFLNMGISISDKFLKDVNNQEKTNLLKGIGELIDNKSIKPEEKEQLKSSYQNLVKNMLKDIEPNNQKQILKTILLALGSNNNFFQKDDISYQSGLKAFKAYLTDNSETKNIFKLLS
ncbi:MAG: hypothetical protein H7263_13475, partial [Candidatus Sericytochromatia bacterium]|nr:hypothetical protein [Candidatus Sericytochromatia bacterium]